MSSAGAPRRRRGALGLLALALYVGAVAWPGPGRVYADGLRGLARASTSSSLDVQPLAQAPAAVRRQAAARTEQDLATAFVLRRQPRPHAKALVVDLRRKAWLPTALVLALAVALARPGRRLRAVVVGLGAVQLFVVARIGSKLLSLAATPAPPRLVELDAPLRDALRLLDQVLYHAPLPGVLVPVLAVVPFAVDWPALAQRLASGETWARAADASARADTAG